MKLGLRLDKVYLHPIDQNFSLLGSFHRFLELECLVLDFSDPTRVLNLLACQLVHFLHHFEDGPFGAVSVWTTWLGSWFEPLFLHELESLQN